MQYTQVLKGKMARMKIAHDKQIEILKIKHTQEMYIERQTR